MDIICKNTKCINFHEGHCLGENIPKMMVPTSTKDSECFYEGFKEESLIGKKLDWCVHCMTPIILYGDRTKVPICRRCRDYGHNVYIKADIETSVGDIGEIPYNSLLSSALVYLCKDMIIRVTDHYHNGDHYKGEVQNLPHDLHTKHVMEVYVEGIPDGSGDARLVLKTSD